MSSSARESRFIGIAANALDQSESCVPFFREFYTGLNLRQPMSELHTILLRIHTVYQEFYAGLNLRQPISERHSSGAAVGLCESGRCRALAVGGYISGESSRGAHSLSRWSTL